MNGMTAGKLEIGDDWNAIQIIAHSQSNPQKTVAELIENSIDAKATKIEIERKKKKGKVILIVTDNGTGVRHNGKIPPESLQEVPRKICDSIKRKLASSDKRGIHGQFGIGLLGFWSLGKRLLMRSKTSESMAYTLEMEKEKREFRVGPSKSERTQVGTDIVIEEVHKEIQSRLSAERLANYLSHELRDRMRQNSLEIVIHDRLTRKTTAVIPSVFKGESIPGLQSISVIGEPEIRTDLYMLTDTEEEVPKVGIAVDGTRVIDDITDLDEFHNPPWTLRRLEGLIDWSQLTISPTRKNLIFDSKYAVFVSAIKKFEAKLLELIKVSERQKEEKIGKDVLKAIQKAFESAFTDLPRSDYSWFGVKDSGRMPGDKPEEAEKVISTLKNEEEIVDSLTKIQEGEVLDRIVLTPSVATITFGKERRFSVKCFDRENRLISKGIEYKWAISKNLGEWLREVSPGVRIFLAHNESGECEISVEANQDGIFRRAQATVVVVPEKPTLEFPRPLENYQPLERWRSRWVEATGIIEINSGHKDFIRAKAAGRNIWMRYLAMLYAKELVLLNFVEFQPQEILERMVEVMSHIETKFSV